MTRKGSSFVISLFLLYICNHSFLSNDHVPGLSCDLRRECDTVLFSDKRLDRNRKGRRRGTSSVPSCAHIRFDALVELPMQQSFKSITYRNRSSATQHICQQSCPTSRPGQALQCAMSRSSTSTLLTKTPLPPTHRPLSTRPPIQPFVKPSSRAPRSSIMRTSRN